MWMDQLSQVSSNHRDHSSSANCNDKQNVRWFGKPIRLAAFFLGAYIFIIIMLLDMEPTTIF